MSELKIWRVYDQYGGGPAYVEASNRAVAIALAVDEINKPESSVVVYEYDED